MPSIPISSVQLGKLIALQKDIDAIVGKRNELIAILVDGSEYAGSDITVTEINDDGIHFTLNGGDPSSSAEVSTEQYTLKLEE